MNIILMLLLIFITAFNYYINYKNVLSPSFIVSGVFCISTMLIIFNSAQWQHQISINTVFFICFALLLFSIGTFLGSKTVINRNKKKDNFLKIDFYSLDISNLNLVWISLLCLIISTSYLLYQYRLSLSLGNTAGLIGIIATIRSQVLINPQVYQLGIFLNLGIAFVRATGYISLFYVVVGFLCKDRKIKKYTIPIVCLIINTILATGRSAFITIVVACLFNIYIVQINRGIKRFNKKMIKYIISGIVVFFSFFRITGILTGKSAILSLWDTISIYAGSSILCLDSYLNQAKDFSSIFGLKTFVGIYNLLNRFGFSFPQGSNHAQFVFWQDGKYASNVYTAFYPYIQDFGIYVAIIMQLILGFIFGIVWKRYHSNNASIFLLITYGRLWGTPLALYSIAEVICSSNLALNTFVEIFFYFIIVNYVMEKKINIFKNNVLKTLTGIN